MIKSMKRCTNCVLPETFPGISFNDQGVCNHCQTYRGHDHLQEAKEKYRQKFEILLKQFKNHQPYDCLMAYSGGKDSTYTLYILKKEYGLNILALTFDNGFISPTATDNIRKVVENLNIDHITVKPRFDLIKRIFLESSKNDLYPPKAMERASSICTSCIGLIKFITLKTALEKNIPFIAYGWSPGQSPITASIFKNNPAMIKQMQNVIKEPLYKIAGNDINNFFLNDNDFENNKIFPYNVGPLAFWQYNENKIFDTIKKLSWEKPEDTDANSTNCLLNSYANYVHKKRFNFHPYAFEMAKLVREGYLDRDEALLKLEDEEDLNTIQNIQEKLLK